MGKTSHSRTRIEVLKSKEYFKREIRQLSEFCDVKLLLSRSTAELYIGSKKIKLVCRINTDAL